MAPQHNVKNGNIPHTASPSHLKHDSVTHSQMKTQELPCRRNPLDTGLVSAFADEHMPWVLRAWKTVCKALPKQGSLCFREVMEPELSLGGSSPQVKCYHQGKLDVLPPLERHILLFMSEQSLLKGHAFLQAENNTLHCTCARTVRPHLDFGMDAVCSSSVGIFLQDYAKDGINLAHRLMNGGWRRRRLHTLAFARLRGEPGIICGSGLYQTDLDFDGAFETQVYNESPASPLLSFHRILPRVFTERILHPVLQQQQQQQQQDFPDKEMLDSVQDFFLYTEFEGRRVFEELDRDADGKLTMEDLRVAMKKMKLPEDYAKDFMQSRHQLWPTKSCKWSDFSSLIQEKEPVIIQLFNSLGVSKSGIVRRTHVKESLQKAGLSATEANVTAMMKFLAADTGDCLKYGQFRRFMLLLPTEQLTLNPWSVWLKAATADGMEPSSGDLQVSVLKYISSLSRDLSHQFEAAKV